MAAKLLWCVTDLIAPYLSLLISPRWLASVLDMLGRLLFPISLAVLMRHYMRRRWTHRAMSVVAAVEIFTAGLCLTLQFTGVADLYEQQLVIGGVALAVLVAADA